MKKYRYFTYASVSLMLISVFSYGLYILNNKLSFMNHEYPMWVDVKRNSIKENNHNFIVIGDSRAKAGFKSNHFDTNNLNSINLSAGGATPIEGFYTLKRYLNNNKPKYLLLSYGPFHLERQDVYWERTVKFDFLDISDNIEVTKYATALNEYNLLSRGNKPANQNHLYSYLDYRYNFFKYLPEFKATLLNNKLSRKKENKDILDILEKSKGHYIFGRRLEAKGLNQESKLTSFKASKLINYYLEKTIELATKNNIKVFWYSMPFNESSFNTTPTLYKKEYNQYITNLVAKNKITTLNNLFYLNDTKFGDPSHLYMGIDEVTEDIKTKFHSKL